MFERAPKTLFTVPQGGVRALLLSDVAGDGGFADYLSRVVDYRRDSKRDIDKTAVLPHPHRFEMGKLAAGSGTIEDRHHFLFPIWRSQSDDVSPDYFLCPVAIDDFRGVVPTGNAAIQGDGKDGVVGGIHDQCEPVSGLFGSLARRDIADDNRDGRKSARLLPDGIGYQRGVESPAALPETDCLQRDTFSGAYSAEYARESIQFLRGHQHGDIFADNLFRAISKQRLRSAVPALDRAARSVVDDGVFRRILERGQEPACTLSSPAVSDVALDCGIGDSHPVRVTDGGDRHFFGVTGAVLAPIDQPASPGLAGGNRAPQLPVKGRILAAGLQHSRSASDHFLARVSRHPGESGADVLNRAGGIADNDGFPRLLDGGGQRKALNFERQCAFTHGQAHGERGGNGREREEGRAIRQERSCRGCYRATDGREAKG